MTQELKSKCCKAKPKCDYCYDKGYYTLARGGSIVLGDFEGDASYYLPVHIDRIPCPRCTKKTGLETEVSNNVNLSNSIEEGSSDFKAPTVQEAHDRLIKIGNSENSQEKEEKKCEACDYVKIGGGFPPFKHTCSTPQPEEKEEKSIGKTIFDMVYQWGRVGVVVDYTAPAYQDEIKKLITQPESEGVGIKFWRKDFIKKFEFYSPELKEWIFKFVSPINAEAFIEKLLQAQDKQIRLEERERHKNCNCNS